MRQLPAEATDNEIIFLIDLPCEALQYLLHHRTSRAGICSDRYTLPGIRINTVSISINDDIKTTNLIRAGTGLCDHNAVFLHRMLRQRVGMSSDYEIHTPGRIQLSREMPVLLKANMRQNNGKIDVDAIVRVTDLSDFCSGGSRIHKRSNQRFRFRLVDHILRDDTDEQDIHAIYPEDLIRSK